MNILGLIGPAGCGKDTVAGFLKGYGYERAASADAMKDDIARYLQISRSDVDYYKDKSLSLLVNTLPMDVNIGSFSIRTFLQAYGMDLRNQHGDNYWIERSVNSKVEEYGESAKIIITDIRFQNEIGYIKERRGKVAYIDGRSSLRGDHKAHISEALAHSEDIKSRVDFIINNSRDIVALHGTLKGLLTRGIIE